jgi:hypothetical protein
MVKNWGSFGLINNYISLSALSVVYEVCGLPLFKKPARQ